MSLGFYGHRATIFAYTLFAIGLAAAAFAGAMWFSHNTRTTIVKKVERSWGKADTSLAGATVNPALKGYTCDVYSSRQTVVCHP